MREIEVFRSPDMRHRTAAYSADGVSCVCIAEPVKDGVLVTRFGEGGEVLDQSASASDDVMCALSAYLGSSFAARITDVASYSAVAVRPRCGGCGGKVVRELDLKKPEEIAEVPVLPVFACTKCGKRLYQIGRRYLTHLVERNKSLFDEAELKELDRNGDAFINTLRENIVRVFAAKKMGRLEI